MTAQHIDRYELREVLGKGAMGTVYGAWDPKLHREVALKLVSQTVSADPKSRERFNREARAIAALRHPNIVEIYDYSGDGSQYLYLVMEKLSGQDLFDLVSQRGPLPESIAAGIGHELCLALAAAHDAGIIHRDIKPENVFVLDSGRVVLTDFGVVKAVRADSAVDGFNNQTEVIGTPGFMSPELMLNAELGPEADIFAMGALLYNITTGHLPYDGKGPMEIYRAVVAGKYRDVRHYNPQISDVFCGTLANCLHPKRKKRYGHANLLRADLKKSLALLGVNDLRDDLRDYMRDPVTYAINARNRLLADLVGKLKIAVKDRDQEEADRLRGVILSMDPHNSDVHSMTGVLNVHEIASRSAPAKGKARGKKSSRKLVPIALALLLALPALTLAAFLHLKPRAPLDALLPPDLPAETAEQAAEPPAEVKRSPATAEVRVRGGAGMLFLNGEKLGRVVKRSLTLDEGNHDFEIRGRGKKLTRTLELKPDQTLWVTVDLKRGRINTEYKSVGHGEASGDEQATKK